MLRHRLRPLHLPSAFPRRRSSSSPRSMIWWTGLAVAPSGLWPSDSPAAPSKWCTPAPPAMISIASASFSGPVLASLTVWSSLALSPTRWLPLFASKSSIPFFRVFTSLISFPLCSFSQLITNHIPHPMHWFALCVTYVRGWVFNLTWYGVDAVASLFECCYIYVGEF